MKTQLSCFILFILVCLGHSKDVTNKLADFNFNNPYNLPINSTDSYTMNYLTADPLTGIRGIKISKGSLAKSTFNDGVMIGLTGRPQYLSFYYSSTDTTKEDTNVRLYQDNVN